MTTTFADYAAQQDARNTIQLNVTKWSLMLCDALKDDAPDGYQYIIESGRKYHKIVMVDSAGGRSVHAFVDRKTGELYKSASWKAPAKGVRYDLRLIEQREWLLENADWAGSYLYAK
jgi:phage-related protein